MVFKNKSFIKVFILLFISIKTSQINSPIIEEDFALSNFLFVIYFIEQIKTPFLHSESDLYQIQKQWLDIFKVRTNQPEDIEFLSTFFNSKTDHVKLVHEISSYIHEIPEVYRLLQNENYGYMEGLQMVESICLKVYDITLKILEHEYTKLLFYFNYFVLISGDEQTLMNVAYSVRDIFGMGKEVQYSEEGKLFFKFLKSKILNSGTLQSSIPKNSDIIHNIITLFDQTSELLAEFIDEFKKKEFFLSKILNDEVKELLSSPYSTNTFNQKMWRISRNTLIGVCYRVLGSLADYSEPNIKTPYSGLVPNAKINEDIGTLYFFKNRMVYLFLEMTTKYKLSFKGSLIQLIINKLTKKFSEGPEKEEVLSLMRRIRTNDVLELAWNTLEIFMANNDVIETIIRSSVVINE